MKRLKLKRESWFNSAKRYLNESSFYVSLAIALFVFSGFVAFSDSSSFSFLDSLLRGLVDKTEGLSTLQLIWFIFHNNSSSAFFALFAGLLFGLVPFSNILVNGAILGYVISKASAVSSLSDILFRLVPHGIFELPAIFIAVGLGMKLGLGFFSTYFDFYSKNKKMKQLFSFVISLVLISFTLFFVSAQNLIFNTAGSSIFFLLSFSVLAVSCFWFLFLLFGDFRLRKGQLETLRYRLTNSFYVFVTIVLPLLIIAAIIEGLLISYL